jgi:hypothetical protein
VQDLQRVLAVIGVSNELTIRSPTDTSAISDDIIHALDRSWFFDAKTISVAAEAGKCGLPEPSTPNTTGRSAR